MRGGGRDRALSRLTARSVVLSVLLGAHPAWASASELVTLTADFGIKEPTLRVALTRMVGAGDLVRSADGYRLSERLLARQRRQDDALDPRLRQWDGTWTTLVITSVGSDARSRAATRNALRGRRFGELREGLWMRPDNVEQDSTSDALDRLRVLTARDDDPVGLAAQLWDLPEWARVGDLLLEQMRVATDTPRRFVAAAGAVRHLLTDPVLPEELLPEGWPGAELRRAYHDFAAELAAQRDQSDLMEAK
jgi:phenylacetic acid degradation operon negative regulatory protein